MITTIDAVYRDGAFYPTTPMDLPDGTVGIAIVQRSRRFFHRRL